MGAIDIIDYKGYTISIFQDEDPESLYDWIDSIFLVYDHRSFCISREGFNPTDIYYNMSDYLEDWFVFPVYAYIHSGVVLSLSNKTYPFNSRYDVSFKGFILADINKFETSEEAETFANSLVTDWNIYLSGNVYGYVITKDEHQIDSCWGFYSSNSDYEDIVFEAKSHVDYDVKLQEEWLKML